jgi:TP901 family phage tail tape measure protein
MAGNRTVAVTLTAQVSGYISGMEQARKKTGQVSDEAQKKLAAQGQAFTSLGSSAMKMGTVAAAGIAIAVKKFADFDKAMSQVKAVTQETAGNMGLLREAALEAGGRTVYSATEAANAVEELGKASISTADILGGALDGALDLAASGQLEVARAAEITATTLKQFGLEGSDASRVADVLSAGAGKALGSVEDLAQGLQYVGPVAGAMGISLEDTTATLALFADQGIIGEQAGSALRGMLASLQNPSAEADAKLKDLGITLYDANGAFVGMGPVVEQLNQKLGDADDQTRDTALGLIFTNAQLTTAQALVGDAGAKWDDYRASVEDSGYATQVANDRMDNLTGDIEKLGGAFDTALIKSGSGANNTLREMVQGLTFLVDAVGGLPEPVTNAGLAIAVAATAIALSGGASLVAAPKWAALKTNVAATGVSMGTFALRAVATGGALATVTLAIGFLIGKSAEAAATTDELTSSLKAGTGELTNYSREIVKKKLAEAGAYDTTKQLGISQKELTDAVLNGGTELDAIYSKLGAKNNIANFFNGQGIAAGNTKSDLESLRGSVVDSKKDFNDLQAAGADVADSNGDVADSSGEVADSYVEVKDVVDGVVTSLSDLIAELDAVNGKNLDAREAARQLEEAYDAFDEGLKKNGKTLDTNTEAGRENEANLDAIAEKAAAAAKAIADTGGSYEEYRASLKTSRTELLDRINDLDIQGEAAEELADSILRIPTKREFEAAVNVDPALGQIERLKQRLASIKDRSVRVDLNGDVSGSGRPGAATGGAISGPGSGTSDSIPVLLSNGEHVLTAEEVRRAGGQGAVYAARQRLMESGKLAFAKGGAVSTSALVDDVKAARRAENSAQSAYDKAKGDARKRAKKRLDDAQEKVERLEQRLADRRAADAELASYTSDVSEQGRDQQFLKGQARSNPRLASQYRKDASDAALQDAEQNVQALRDIIADPKQSKANIAKAKRELPKQIAVMNAAKLKQITDETAAEAAAAAQEAADEIKEAAEALAASIKDIADEFSDIDLSSLEEETTTFSRVVNPDGSISTSVSKGMGSPTAKGINAFFADQSADNGRFAGKLKQLAGKIPVALLSYLVSLGVDKGEPYADALLSASGTTLASITANYNASTAGANAIGAIVAPLLGHAGGGAVYGPGTGTSDSVVRRLSDGEHVLSAADVKALGGQSGVYAMRESLYRNPPSYAPAAYAARSGYSAQSQSGPAQFTVVLESKGGIDLIPYVKATVVDTVTGAAHESAVRGV